MSKWIGKLCIFFGVICLIGSMGFLLYNRWEEKNAEQMAKQLVEEAQDIIEEKRQNSDLTEDMATIKVDGYDCIGILSVPVLKQEWPILKEWSYVKLKKAPCHYYGSYSGKNFVIAGHNYEAHFGRLSGLQPKDLIIFTDANGIEHYYEVVLLETLQRDATMEMIASDFDLSLYTCTIGGKNRVTVRCKAIER